MYKSFNLIKDLYFVRTGGSAEELKAASIIKEKIEELNGTALLEEFEVDGYNVHKASLSFDDELNIECAGVGISSSTSIEGVSGEFIYITSLEDAKMKDVKNKICLVHSKLVNEKLYETLVKKQAIGLILCCGDVYKNDKDVDLDPYMYREWHTKYGKIPAVCIRMKDAERVILKKPHTAKIILIQDEFKNKSHNVVSTIKGSDFPNEVIVFTAHYDSVSYSKGAYDNASGAASILHLYAYYMKNQPKRTLKFVWCGSEEMGLLGSKAYVNMHKDEIENYLLCINVDMLGATIGYDIACATTEVAFINYLNYTSCEFGFPISVKQGVYSSDSTSFSDAGVPAVSFARIAPNGGAVIHSHNDVIDHLSKDNYYNSCEFIKEFSMRLINASSFPVERKIPDNMKEELDYYLKRKERK